MLFNIVVADVEEEFRRRGWGGVRIGGNKVYTLAYADDMVLMAEDEERMREMISGLEGYLEKKKLELNVEKTKIMRFRKGGGRMKRARWYWKGARVEEVKKMKYLGYVMQRNGGQEAQVRERVRKATAVMRQVWGIGKRRFKEDWARRMKLLDMLVWPVMGFGGEIWGWKEREGVEKGQERGIRWIMGVDWRTPGYMVREEVQREKWRTRLGKRAWRFEEKLREGRAGELARWCWEEMTARELADREKSGWEKEREGFMCRLGVNGNTEWEEVERKDREQQRGERWERIQESRVNRWYKMVKGEGVPGYLQKGWGESRWRRVIRFRLGNEIREGRYWEEEGRRECRVCGSEEETWEHVWERCGRREEEGGGWQENVGRILGGEGEGEGWMREIERLRSGESWREERVSGYERREDGGDG